MGGIRRDIATLGETWSDTILWYAKAVAELDSLPIDNQRSWRFLAAIHGFYGPGWVDAGVLMTGEKVPTELVDGTFGSQCQHGSWYFLPWHRGYLAAFEAIIADTIKKLGGPDDWTLPYWNYLDTNNADARKIPEAFLLKSLPDGSDNPLNKPPRRPTTVLKPPRPGLTDINLNAMNEPDFVVGANDRIGFGGTSIATGDLEFNPHNSVHVFIGGFLGDPDYAGLDPIFWLHHCNIDRLWEAWMQTPGRTMVQAAQWKEGPVLPRFIMPAPKAGDPDLNFVPRDTLKGGKLYPVYDESVSSNDSGGLVQPRHYDPVSWSLTLRRNPPGSCRRTRPLAQLISSGPLWASVDTAVVWHSIEGRYEDPCRSSQGRTNPDRNDHRTSASSPRTPDRPGRR